MTSPRARRTGVCASVPLWARPTAERTASTMTMSVIGRASSFSSSAACCSSACTACAPGSSARRRGSRRPRARARASLPRSPRAPRRRARRRAPSASFRAIFASCSLAYPPATSVSTIIESVAIPLSPGKRTRPASAGGSPPARGRGRVLRLGELPGAIEPHAVRAPEVPEALPSAALVATFAERDVLEDLGPVLVRAHVRPFGIASSARQSMFMLPAPPG